MTSERGGGGGGGGRGVGGGFAARRVHIPVTMCVNAL